ncbi:MAG: ATP synthase F1 subunit delta [Candidatus Eremiobacteraeota bacterium]|nr:ATP synthase F1 subunit delta [Candidatus Eremiobacteraeota bacterium]
MADEKVARRYATAVFSLATDKDAAQRVGADLATIAKAIGEDALTREFYRAPTVDRKNKEHALSAAFKGKVDDVALNTLLLLVRKRREALLDSLLVEYRKLEQTARGAEPLTVTTARVLPQTELTTMVERLEHVYGKKFDVSVRHDASLIGGVRIMMGDRRIDGTVAGRLEELARNLFAHNN